MQVAANLRASNVRQLCPPLLRPCLPRSKKRTSISVGEQQRSNHRYTYSEFGAFEPYPQITVVLCLPTQYLSSNLMCGSFSDKVADNNHSTYTDPHMVATPAASNEAGSLLPCGFGTIALRNLLLHHTNLSLGPLKVCQALLLT